MFLEKIIRILMCFIVLGYLLLLVGIILKIIIIGSILVGLILFVSSKPVIVGEKLIEVVGTEEMSVSLDIQTGIILNIVN